MRGLKMKKVEIVKEKNKLKMEAKMKKLLTLLMLIVPLVILAQADAGVTEEEVIVEGEVVEVEEVSPPYGEVNVIQAKIKTQNKEMLQAQLGPAWFLDEDIKVGDKLKLQGALKENKLQVKVIEKNTHRYNIRNEEGEPLYNPVKEKTMKGRIEELYLERKTLKFEAWVRIRENERVRVQLGPEWFLRNRVRVGDEIEVRGSESGFDGGKLLLVREMRNLRNKEEVTLRNRLGFPQWAGKEGEQLHNRIRNQKRDGSHTGEMQQERLRERDEKGKR
jgi:hypothetical protein